MRYQDIYPSAPLLNSQAVHPVLAANLLTLEYFEAAPGAMPAQAFDEHHILINLNDTPHRVEHWRDGVHEDFIFHRDEVVVTPAGVLSGWRWHATSKCIVITLQPEAFYRFALQEVGVLLSAAHLASKPRLRDENISAAARFLLEALATRDLGYEVMFESLARVFLVKLIQNYGAIAAHPYDAHRGLSASQYKRILDYVKMHMGTSITTRDLAAQAGISAPHFSRVFKATIGQSPMQFVLAYRLEQARKMLVQSDARIADIAQRAGFADQAHLSRAVKKAFGHSPKALRAQGAKVKS